MKDLYTFDASPEEAMAAYQEVREAYDRIFRRIGLPFHVVGHFVSLEMKDNR